VVPLSLPEVDKIELDGLKFYVITEANYQKIFDDLRKKNYDPVIFGVTDDGYEMLSVNMAKILQMVQQQKAVIIAYRKYYDKQNEAVEENNESARKEKVIADQSAKDDKGNGGILPDASLFKRFLPW
jgi:hypothetical protein